jgi:hypothetical protein
LRGGRRKKAENWSFSGQLSQKYKFLDQVLPLSDIFEQKSIKLTGQNVDRAYQSISNSIFTVF